MYISTTEKEIFQNHILKKMTFKDVYCKIAL